MNISTVEQMRYLDRTAIEKYGIPDLLLMENAGLAVCSLIRKKCTAADRRLEDSRFVIVCGGGNNGGDGFVIARKLHSDGAAVQVYFFGKEDSLKDSAKINFEICKSLGISVDASRDLALMRPALLHADAVIDALFGTGLDRDVTGEYELAVKIMNECGKPVYSVDIPSGIQGNTGAVMGTAVRADCTVTFGLPKLGNIFYPGASSCGELYVTHISFPPEHYGSEDFQVHINVPVPLPDRDPAGHKGSFGRCLFIAGASGYYGAPLFCSRAFLKAGGGYSRLAAPASVIQALAGENPEIVYHVMRESTSGGIAADNLERILSITGGRKNRGGNGADFLVAGPGTGPDDETAELVRLLAVQSELPLLIDGDGLRAIAGHEDLLVLRKSHTVLTPHPGETAALLRRSVADVVADPIGSAREAARMYQAHVVLKGARTCIADPSGTVRVNLSGNSGMGTAGSGDVLAGIIPALYGLGLEFADAVAAGVWLHGFAGDLAAAETGEDGMTAGDICEALPAAMSKFRAGEIPRGITTI